MDTGSSETWLRAVASLTRMQRRQAFEALALSEAAENDDLEAHDPAHQQAADDKQTADAPSAARPGGTPGVAALGQRRVNTSGCPHCAHVEVVRWGTASGLPRYRCKACARTFNALTKMPLAKLRMKEKWSAQAEALIGGVSLAKAAGRCGVHATTASRRRHRFLALRSGHKPKALTSIVESGEAFILESFKGRRSGLPWKPRKRGGVSAKRGLSMEEIPIIVARDRRGATTDAVVAKLDRALITAAPGDLMTSANTFCCDGGGARCLRTPRWDCRACLANARQTNPNAADFHLNNVNAYHGRLKEWLRRFHGVATQNLPNYLGWRRALEALGQNAAPANIILGAIGLGPYQQTTG